MARYIIPGFRKIETSGGGEGGTTNYNDLTNKPFINNVPLVGNLRTVNLKLTDATLTEEGVPAEAKTVGQRLEEQSTSLTALSNQLGNHTVKSDVPENAVFTDTVYNDKDIKAEIAKKADATSVPSKVSELTNDSNYQTAEQVNSTVITEISKVVADAPEDFDTLKEMSDWIAGHEDDASAMNSAISDNKTAIASLQTGKADKSEIPKTLPADGGNADTVNNHTVETDVPVDAKFTDTVYDDTEVKRSIIELNSKYAKKDLYDDTTVNIGRLPDSEKGENSTAIGEENTASGLNSFASGLNNTASGKASHAEGQGCIASGGSSNRTGGAHAEGNGTTASGNNGAHAEGYRTTASGNNGAHAEGYGTIASGTSQHVEGKYNVDDTENKYAHILGNGKSDTERSNAHTVDWEGNAWYAGDVTNGNGVSLDGLNSNLEKIKLNDKTESANSSDILITNNYCFVENNVIHINMSIRALNNVAPWNKLFRFNGYNLYASEYITIFDCNNHQNSLGYYENGWFNIAEELTQGNDYVITGTVSID